MKHTNIDILDILIVLAKKKKFIIITTFVVTVTVIIYSLLATKYWKSAVSFLTVSQAETSSLIPQGLLGGMGASFLGMEAGGDALNFIQILQSRTFSERIVNKYDLISYFELEDPDTLVVMEQAVRELHEKMLDINLDPETGMISIAIESKDRYLSSDIANTYFVILEDYFLRTKMSKGRERRQFLEERIKDFEQSFAELTRRIEEFQRENRIIDIEAQKEQIVKLYAEIVAKKTEAEIELEYTKKFAGENSPIVKGLADKVAVYNKTIRGFESGSGEMQPKYIVNIDDIPDLNSRFLQLSLNLEIQKKVIEYLYPQFEKAKLDELSDISTFELIDRAIPAGMRSRPRRAKLVIIGFVLALFLSSLLAYTHEIFTTTERKGKLDELLRELFGRR